MENTDFFEDRRKEIQENDYTIDHYERRADNYFTIKATTPDLNKIFYQLRHIVYCEEHPEFNEHQHIDKEESDQFDAHSINYLLFYKPLHMVVGGVRLILPMDNENGCGLPSVQLENSPFLKDFPYDLGKMGELSRFLISKQRMELVNKHQEIPNKFPLYSLPALHLIRCVFEECSAYKFDGFIATLTPMLIRGAKQHGVNLWEHGEPVKYHGTRQGAYLLIKESLDWMKQNNIKNYQFFKE